MNGDASAVAAGSSHSLAIRAAAECSNGVDDDQDGLADHPADPGCASAADLSQDAPLLVCDDGVDNDGDGLVDKKTTGGDPGCQAVTSALENPKCDDDVDNDGDGKIDANGPGTRDPQCTAAWRNKESGGCGLGFELVLVMPVLAALRMRRRRAGVVSV